MAENEIDWRERISVDPLVCHGKPCIRGTRVLVTVVLDNVAAGEPFSDIAGRYRIGVDDIRACPAYASALAKGRFVPVASEVA